MHLNYLIYLPFIMANFIYAGMFYMHFSKMETTDMGAVVPMVFIIMSVVSFIGGIFAPLVVKAMKMAESEFAQKATIFSGAFFESIAIYGLVGKFVGLSNIMCYGLIAASTLFLILNFPRVIKWNSSV